MKTFFIFIAVFFGGFSFILNAAIINDIKFEQQGGYSFPSKMLLYNMQQKVGKIYDKNKLNDDIKRLYGLGFFDDVVSEVKELPGDSVEIILKVKVKPRVVKIIFKGNRKFPTKKLKTNVVLDTGVPLNDNKLRVSANRIRAFYRDKGYNEA